MKENTDQRRLTCMLHHIENQSIPPANYGLIEKFNQTLKKTYLRRPRWCQQKNTEAVL